MPRRKNFKVWVAAALLVAFVFISIPNISSAGDDAPGVNWWNCLSPTSAITCSIYVITLTVSWIMNLFIALGAYLTRIALSYGTDVINLPAVQTGFSVSLSIANLGFVLGIIVIALATILRSQTYGIKQILWKLVVAAIMVNFGLVIAGTILSVSDKFTNYFMSPFSGNPFTSGNSSNFVNKLTGSLGANKMMAPPLEEGDTDLVRGYAKCEKDNPTDDTFLGLSRRSSVAQKALQTCQEAVDGAVKENQTIKQEDPALAGLNNFMRGILALIFVIIFNFIIAFTFFALAILLIIRFIYIGILLIILPLAWLMWIFPKFSHMFSKWWSNFLRWAFFPAIATFFLYLAILTAAPSTGTTTPITPQTNTAANALGFMTNAPGPIGAAASEILIVGLALGGLFAANSLGIHGAAIAMGTMKSVGTMARGYVGRQGKRAASRAVPTNVKEKLQGGGYRVVPKRVQSWLGRGLGAVEKAGGGNLVDKEGSWARENAKNPKEGARLLAGSLDREKQMALLKQMVSQGDIGEVEKVSGKHIDEFRADEKTFKNAGQEKLLLDLDKALGRTVQQVQASSAIGKEQEKEKPKTDAIDNNLDSLKKKYENIERAQQQALQWHLQDPNNDFDDPDGSVTGKAGTRMKTRDFIHLADQRSSETASAINKAEGLKSQILASAAARATIIDAKNTLGKGVGAVVNAVELQEKEAEVVKKMSQSDAQKVAGNAIFGKGERMGLSAEAADSIGESFARALALHAPQLVSPIIKKMKSDPLDKFSGIYTRILNELIRQNDGNKQLKDLYTNRLQSFEKSVAYNMMGGGFYEEGEEGGKAAGGGTATPPPSGGKSTT